MRFVASPSALSALVLALASGAAPTNMETTNASEAALGRASVEDSGFGRTRALKMYEHVPATLPASPPLVLVLHGCTQKASDIAQVVWSELADELARAVVCPEQQSGHSPIRCFDRAAKMRRPPRRRVPRTPFFDLRLGSSIPPVATFPVAKPGAERPRSETIGLAVKARRAWARRRRFRSPRGSTGSLCLNQGGSRAGSRRTGSCPPSRRRRGTARDRRCPAYPPSGSHLRR